MGISIHEHYVNNKPDATCMVLLLHPSLVPIPCVIYYYITLNFLLNGDEVVIFIKPLQERESPVWIENTA